MTARIPIFLLYSGFVSTLLLLTQGSPGQEQNSKPPDNLAQNTKRVGPAPEIKPAIEFKTREGKSAWKVAIPGNRPLATPAVVDGKVLIGGGFGSHEFYALDAKTGKKLWLYRTGDDGPTAAAVEGGYIAFNTESCELEILTLDGQRVWKKWLGDPLMSMPAISKGKVYMCYPDSKQGRGQHYLACFDIKTGKEQWKQSVPGDIITAPVIADDKIYVATLEGTLSCFHEQDGKLAWADKKNITSSPTIWDGRCFFSRRDTTKIKDKNGKDVTQQWESLSCRSHSATATVKDFEYTRRLADYLDAGKRMARSAIDKADKAGDAGVGFSTAPEAAKLEQAIGNLGQNTVAGVWSYQGSRPFIYKDRLYSAMGDTVKCVDPKTEKVVWTKQIKHHNEKQELVDAAVTPPAIVNGRIFLGTCHGQVICLTAETGGEEWRATLGGCIMFQPAVAGGRVYVSTREGTLYAVETGDTRDDGWLMWGGNAQHNGLVREGQ